MIHENNHIAAAKDDYLDPEICAAGFAVMPYLQPPMLARSRREQS